MQKKSTIVALTSVLAAGLPLGVLLAAGGAAAADRRGVDTTPSQYSMPGTNATPSQSKASPTLPSSSQDGYQANYHADYHLKTGGTPTQGEEPEQRETIQRDWRNHPAVDRPGRAPSSWPR